MKQVRWGIIGCGDVTENKSGPAFSKARNSSLVAVMRRDGKKAADYAKRHNVPRWYNDAAGLIADPQVNAVYIATPPDAHEQYTTLTAAAGKPVYVEKPMARTFEECKRMVHACRKAQVPLFVAYYRRSLPRFVKVKQLVDEGAIGHVRHAGVRLYQPPEKDDLNPKKLPWRVNPDIAGAGRFLDLASHTLDLLDFILGPINSARGHAANQAHLYPAEDAVTASFSFDSGALGTGAWCFTSQHRFEEVELIGDKGRITFSTFGDTPVTLQSKRKPKQFKIPHPEHIQQPMIQAIVDELTGKGTSPSTGETASRTSRVMDLILADWRSLKVR